MTVERRAPNYKRFEEPENHRFTVQYSQPDDYHYCQDSVIFPMFVAEVLRNKDVGADFRALDVCAGCGVIGLEIAHYEPRLERFDFIEIQSVFRGHFEENLVRADRMDREFRFLPINYSRLSDPELAETYDLIVGNPPYFVEGEGKLSPSSVKSRCRFFLDADLATLLLGVVNALKRGGSSYLLMKTGRRHGRDSFADVRALVGNLAHVEIAADVRGTSVVALHRL